MESFQCNIVCNLACNNWKNIIFAFSSLSAALHSLFVNFLLFTVTICVKKKSIVITRPPHVVRKSAFCTTQDAVSKSLKKSWSVFATRRRPLHSGAAQKAFQRINICLCIMQKKTSCIKSRDDLPNPVMGTVIIEKTWVHWRFRWIYIIHACGTRETREVRIISNNQRARSMICGIASKQRRLRFRPG